MLVLSALVVLGLATTASGQDCRNGTVWTNCGSPCTKDCLNRNPVCIERCEPKCQCPPSRPYWLNNTCHNETMCNRAGQWDRHTTPMPEPMPGTTEAYWYPWTTAISPNNNCSRCMGGACGYDGGCDYGCADGWYGWDCTMRCSSNCLYAACDSEDGYCSHGCVNGTDGAFCEDYCSKGCYGDWGECEMYDQDGYTIDCSWDQECFDCKCQGAECVYDKPYPSSAPVLISSTLLLLLSITLCSMLA